MPLHALKVSTAVITILTGYAEATQAQSGSADANQQAPLVQLRLAQDAPRPGFVFMQSASGKHKVHVASESVASD
jgi:hypothetical protein